MKIHNIRYGFATNSSSTHSIILLNEGEIASDDRSGQAFGWDFFTAASEDAKREYMAQQLMQSLMSVHNLPADQAALIAEGWADCDVDPEGYVDHQSVITFPCKVEYGQYSVRKDFFDAVLKFMLQPNIVIGGGNDNADETHFLLQSGKGKNILSRYRHEDEDAFLQFFLEHRSKLVRARFDSTGNFWSLFDSENGTKIRVSFENGNANKSEVPELVDIKITDYCDEGCRYCYQGSTVKGEHANMDVIRQVMHSLAELETFEVAIGGGEPTQHPKFIDILREFHSYGIKPNFSTRNADWVVDHWSEIKNFVGAVGLSVDNNSTLLDKLSKLHGLSDLRLTVQVAVGSCSETELKFIMETCSTFHVTVLFLGWKDTHRGKKGPLYEDVNVIKVLESFMGDERQYPNGESYRPWNGPKVAFDTVMVQQMKEWLEQHSKSWYFSTREGAHSMYIDCVTKKMSQSSYVDTFMPLVEQKRKWGDDGDDGALRSLYGKSIREYFASL